MSNSKYEVSESGCWLWLGYCDRNGYARAYSPEAKTVVWAHRYSYEQSKGDIPPGHEIDHVCQVTRCVNPEHLEAVTKTEHVRRTMQRLGKDDLHLAAARLRRIGASYVEIASALEYSGRNGAASAVRSAIDKGLISADEIPTVRHLNDIERQEIADLVQFGIPQTVVAEAYGVDSSHVSRVSRGLTSGHRQRKRAS